LAAHQSKKKGNFDESEMKMLPRVVNHEWFVFDKEREC
jgi:hypothetical protein